MKNIQHWVLLLFSIVVLASCGSSKPTTTENKTQTTTITETLHDTIFKVEKDSSFYEALLECRAGKVVVKNVTNATPGRNLKAPKVKIHNNKLGVDCEARAQELLAQYKNTHIANKEVVTKEKTIEVNKLTWWQQTQINLFRILATILLLYIAWRFVKFKFI